MFRSCVISRKNQRVVLKRCRLTVGSIYLSSFTNQESTLEFITFMFKYLNLQSWFLIGTYKKAKILFLRELFKGLKVHNFRSVIDHTCDYWNFFRIKTQNYLYSHVILNDLIFLKEYIYISASSLAKGLRSTLLLYYSWQI